MAGFVNRAERSKTRCEGVSFELCLVREEGQVACSPEGFKKREAGISVLWLLRPNFKFIIFKFHSGKMNVKQNI